MKANGKRRKREIEQDLRDRWERLKEGKGKKKKKKKK
jgi:hypothetical protein